MGNELVKLAKEVEANEEINGFSIKLVLENWKRVPNENYEEELKRWEAETIQAEKLGGVKIAMQKPQKEVEKLIEDHYNYESYGFLERTEKVTKELSYVKVLGYFERAKKKITREINESAFIFPENQLVYTSRIKRGYIVTLNNIEVGLNPEIL